MMIKFHTHTPNFTLDFPQGSGVQTDPECVKPVGDLEKDGSIVGCKYRLEYMMGGSGTSSKNTGGLGPEVGSLRSGCYIIIKELLFPERIILYVGIFTEELFHRNYLYFIETICRKFVH
jgi:hypothetical protein